jgi:hypothetical protein
MNTIERKIISYSDKPIDEQKKRSEEIRTQFPDCIPILIIPSAAITGLVCEVFIIKKTARIADLLIQVRRKLKISEMEGIFLFLKQPEQKNGSIILHPDLLMSEVDKKYSNGAFAQFNLEKENVFGNNLLKKVNEKPREIK